MSNRREIERVGRHIWSSGYEVQRLRDRFMQEVYYLRHWWQGQASKDFAQEYGQLDAVVNRIFAISYRLEYKLNRLATAVDRAKEERRRRKRTKSS